MEKAVVVFLTILVAIAILAVVGGVIYLLFILLPFILGAAGIGLIAILIVFGLYFTYKYTRKLFASPNKSAEKSE